MVKRFLDITLTLRIVTGLTTLAIIAIIGIGNAEVNNVQTEAKLRFDGMYARKAGEFCYIMRFFQDGLVVATTMDKAICGDTIRTVISRDDGLDQKGHYSIKNSHIEFSTLSTIGVQVDYEGEIKKDSLILNTYSHYNKRKFPNRVYLFYTVPTIAREVKAQEKKTTEMPKAKIGLLNYIKGLISYDKYGNPESYTLEDIAGKNVAQKLFEFSRYNPKQIAKELLIDPNTGKVFHITEYDNYGKAKNEMWLCLDNNGQIVEKDDNPILVKPFNLKQRINYKNEYDGAFLSKKRLEIYPCENCSDNAESKDCSYVW